MSDDFFPELTEEKRKTAEAEAEKRLNRFYRNVFSGVEGIEVLTDIVENECHYFTMVGFMEPHEIVRIMAQKDVGLAILKRVCLGGLEAKDIIKLFLSVPIKGDET